MPFPRGRYGRILRADLPRLRSLGLSTLLALAYLRRKAVHATGDHLETDPLPPGLILDDTGIPWRTWTKARASLAEAGYIAYDGGPGGTGTCIVHRLPPLPNGHQAKIPLAVLQTLRELDSLDAALVYAYVASFDGGRCHASSATIAQAIGAPRYRRVQEALATLRRAVLATTTRTGPRGYERRTIQLLEPDHVAAMGRRGTHPHSAYEPTHTARMNPPMERPEPTHTARSRLTSRDKPSTKVNLPEGPTAMNDAEGRGGDPTKTTTKTAPSSTMKPMEETRPSEESIRQQKLQAIADWKARNDGRGDEAGRQHN